MVQTLGVNIVVRIADGPKTHGSEHFARGLSRGRREVLRQSGMRARRGWLLTKYHLSRELCPVMKPEMAPRPMGRPTERIISIPVRSIPHWAEARVEARQAERRTGEDRVASNVEEDLWEGRHGAYVR